MKVDLISIVIPNYNHEPFLRSRLESVFSQTYPNIEVILLDDASTDGSVNILKTYANHPKVSHFIVNETNSGSPFRQWEKGIELAKGDYVWIAESDDFCEVNFLEKLISFIDTKTVVAFCGSNVVNQESLFIKKNTWAQQHDDSLMKTHFNIEGQKLLKKHFRYRNMIPNTSAAIFKKEYYRKKMLKTNFSFCGDWYFWCQMCKCGNFVYVNEFLNHYRRHEASTRTPKALKKEIERINEYFCIITQYSSTFSRLLNMRKYKWIFEEINAKQMLTFAPNNSQLQLPLDFKLFYFIKRIKNKIYKPI